MLFLHDNTSIQITDPTGALLPANATLDRSTVNGQTIAPAIGQMIVAGDGNAYVPYVYKEETDTFSDPATTSTHVVTHVMIMRASPDGNSAKLSCAGWLLWKKPVSVNMQPLQTTRPRSKTKW